MPQYIVTHKERFYSWVWVGIACMAFGLLELVCHGGNL